MSKKWSITEIDLSEKRSRSSVSKAIVRCCEESGIFKVVNHGVSMDIISRLEREGLDFFSRPDSEKQKEGPADPFGYGSKTIGFNGDVGQLEHLLLHTHLHHPSNFSFVREYVRSVRNLACKLLDLVAEELRAPNKDIFSELIRDVESDSFLRLNHYPPSLHVPLSDDIDNVDFGEHTDPHILTILRSNDVGGLQICTSDGLWVAIPADPDALFVMIGDALQVMTNDRFQSVKHRVVIVSTKKRRISMMYFCAPRLDTRISPLLHLVGVKGSGCQGKYKAFTWSEYKKATYASKLADCRLNLFKRL